jgi:hypothetical protein
MCHPVFSTKDFESKARHSEIRAILPRPEGRDENGPAATKEGRSHGAMECWSIGVLGCQLVRTSALFSRFYLGDRRNPCSMVVRQHSHSSTPSPHYSLAPSPHDSALLGCGRRLIYGAGLRASIVTHFPRLRFVSILPPSSRIFSLTRST